MNDINHFPLVTLELHHMKTQVMRMVADQHIKWDAQIKVALDRACEPANVQRVIDATVAEAFQSAVRDAVNGFFRYGAGNQVVRELVEKSLRDQFNSSKRRARRSR